MTLILVIDDDEAIRSCLLELLRAEDFGGLSAANGNLGLQLAQRHQPDLIICDVTMPDFSGHDVLRRLRQNRATATIPFIFLSGCSGESDRQQGMALGAAAYLTKPCSAGRLLQEIATHLPKLALA